MTDGSAPGHVYLLINRSMPGMLRVGHTIGPPAECAAEASAASGAPDSFDLVLDVFVPDCAAAEGLLRTLLADRGYPPSGDRACFRAPIREAVALLLQLRDRVPRASMPSAPPAEATASAPPAPAVATALPTPEAPVRDVRRGDVELVREAAEICIHAGEGSAAALVERLRMGYGQASRLLDELSRLGVLGKAEGEGPRRVLVSLAELDRRLDRFPGDAPDPAAG